MSWSFPVCPSGRFNEPHSQPDIDIQPLPQGSNAAAAIEVLQGMGHLQITPNQVCFSAVAWQRTPIVPISHVNYTDDVTRLPVALLDKAMDACSRAARPDEAIDILHQMQNQTIAPDVVALSSIVNAFSQLGKAADAAKWLEQAENVGLSPNIITYNCIIHACARVGHPKKAWRADFFFSMLMENSGAPNFSPSSQSYHDWEPDGSRTDCDRQSSGLRG